MIGKYACFKHDSTIYKISDKYVGKIYEVLKIETIDLSDLNNSNRPDEVDCVTLKESDNKTFDAYCDDLVFSDSIKQLENYIYLS